LNKLVGADRRVRPNPVASGLAQLRSLRAVNPLYYREDEMSRFNSPLDHVRVAAPCSADWDHMIGNDRARFCGQCNLNVYNLSSMTKSEAESFIAGSEGRLCVRFYRRFDGSILTENCPVGLRKIRRRLSAVTRAITSAALSFFAGLGMQEGLSSLGQAARPRTMGQLLREPERLPVIADRAGSSSQSKPI
jgi:hypothetical protein